jgi:hypothetical protein
MDPRNLASRSKSLRGEQINIVNAPAGGNPRRRSKKLMRGNSGMDSAGKTW